MQVLSPDGPKQWRLTKLVDLQRPHSAAPTENGEGLWILQRRERELTFYTQH